MALYKSKNPALRTDTFTKGIRVSEGSPTMTINGTVDKASLLGLIVFGGALFTWNLYWRNPDFTVIQPYVIGGFISALVIAIIIVFNKTMAPYLAPVYCLLEGLALGGFSAFMEQRFPGIVLQAIVLTFGILFSLLLIYRLKIIQATENFKLIVASATAGIGIYYLISILGSFIGFHMPFLHDNSTFGIIFSLFIVVIAALNLVVDFDFIEQGARSKAPKYMEWYAAFGLMVTIIWLYIEILRLLAKLRGRN
jgi:uncharacterized YccA/Bax inhibitor family protein